MTIGRSCIVCGTRTTGTSRCPTHQVTLTHNDTQYRRNRALALARDGHECVICGLGPADGLPIEVDHIVPLTAGGTHALTNLRTVCHTHQPRGG